MKKTSALLVAAMSLTTVAAMANPFSDVPTAHWAYDAVKSLSNTGILQGYPDGTYKGDKVVTRYHLAMIVAKMLARIEQDAELGSGASGISKEDLQTLEKLTVEFADELALLGVKVTALEDDLQSVKGDVEGLKKDVNNIKSNINNGGFDKVQISGDMLVRHDDGLDGAALGESTSAMFRLRFDAKIDENIDAAVRTVLYSDVYGSNLGGAANNAAIFDNANAIDRQNDVDIAYIRIKDVLNGTLKVGRDMYTHGAGFVMNDYADAVNYNITSGKIMVGLNVFYNSLLTRDGAGLRYDKNIWNLNLDTNLKGHDLYLGYYNVDYGDNGNPDTSHDNKSSWLELGAKGDIDKNGRFGYEIAFAATDFDAEESEGELYHVAIDYKGVEDWGFKLAYTSTNDEYTRDGITVDHFQRMIDGIETPLDDIARMGYTANRKMRDMENLKLQACYAPVNSKHGARIAYDMYKQDQNPAYTNGVIGATAEDEANILTIEYQYKLAENTRLRMGFATLDGDKASENREDDRYYIEVYSHF